MSGLVDGAPRPPRLCARRDRADRRPVRATRPPEPRRVPGPRGLVARAAFGAWMSPSSAACFYLAPTSRGKFAKIAARRLRKRKVPDAQGTPKSCQATLSSTGQPSGEAFGGVLGERTAIIGRIPSRVPWASAQLGSPVLSASVARTRASGRALPYRDHRFRRCCRGSGRVPISTELGCSPLLGRSSGPDAADAARKRGKRSDEVERRARGAVRRRRVPPRAASLPARAG